MWSIRYSHLITFILIFIAYILQKTCINFVECMEVPTTNSGAKPSSITILQQPDETEPVDERYSPKRLYIEYLTAIAECKTLREIVKESMIYMRDTFPQELIADSEDDDTIERFIMKAVEEIDPSGRREKTAFFLFKTSIRIYQAVTLLDLQDDTRFIERIFVDVVRKYHEERKRQEEEDGVEEEEDE
jgi:hypothetical protein